MLAKGGGGVRGSDPETSHNAADTVEAARLNRIYWQVAWVHRKNGVNDEEVSAITGIDLQSLTPRPAQLRKVGVLIDMVEADGKTYVTRPGKSGKPRRVRVAIAAPPKPYVT